MRKATIERIDALHAEIAALIAEEIERHDKANPCEYFIHQQIAHTRIQHYRLCPADRGLMHHASATLPTNPPAPQGKE